MSNLDDYKKAAQELNKQPVDRQSDETRLSDIVTAYTKAVISMCSGDKPDVSDDAKRLKTKILAWHETEKQNAINNALYKLMGDIGIDMYLEDGKYIFQAKY